MSQMIELVNGESVVVAHVESPVRFYCRLETDEPGFHQLNDVIGRQVTTGHKQLPDLLEAECLHQPILVYSSIRDRWCRGKLLSFHRNKLNSPAYAKVLLVDYGSVEFVSWKVTNILPSTADIAHFNNGNGFCFGCSLGGIKPFNTAAACTKPLDEWSSYANYIFEKETKHRKFLLKLIGRKNGLVVCDLLDSDSQDHLVVSMSDFLVKSNVALYLNHTFPPAGGGLVDEEEKENQYILSINDY